METSKFKFERETFELQYNLVGKNLRVGIFHEKPQYGMSLFFFTDGIYWRYLFSQLKNMNEDFHKTIYKKVQLEVPIPSIE